VEDDQYEYVSKETVQEIVLFVYKNTLRLQHFTNVILSWQDAHLTMRAIFITLSLLVLSYIFGDGAVLMLISNILIIYPILSNGK